MNVFEAVKQSVTTRQAAEHYGIRVGRNGMACCPFHNDKTPSMKLDRRYHCFGCGADGDVIDFAAALYGLAKKEAAVQLAQDFGLSYEDWNKDREYDRLGLTEEYTEFLGNKVVCHSIPIRPGRNVAIIVESAAVNHRQKQMGYNAAQELYRRVQENLKKNM